MKTFLIALSIIALSSQAFAKKLHYPLEVTSGMADLIVTGEIASVSEGVYQFNVSETIKGESESSITVQMFREWTCDVRWKKAEKDANRYFPHEYFYQILLSEELTPFYQIDPENSWMLAAAKENLPIFVPGWEDSTLGNMFVANQFLFERILYTRLFYPCFG